MCIVPCTSPVQLQANPCGDSVSDAISVPIRSCSQCMRYNRRCDKGNSWDVKVHYKMYRGVCLAKVLDMKGKKEERLR